MSFTIAHIVGARPNYMKVAPVMRSLASYQVVQRLVDTGQHYDDTMSRQFIRDLGLGEPDVHLGVGSGSHASRPPLPSESRCTKPITTPASM